MKIASVRIEVLKVHELAFVVDKVRPRMPGPDVQLDDAVAGDPKRDDVFKTRPRLIALIARWRHTDQPFLAAQRTEALRDPAMTRDPGEAEANMRQVHDPQSRRAVCQDEVRLARCGFRVVMGLGALPAGCAEAR